MGDALLAPNEMLAHALSKAETLPLLFRYGAHHRLLSKVREGDFIGWPVQPGPREMFLHYAPLRVGPLIRLGGEDSARASSLPTARHVRFVGLDEEALSSALDRLELSEACALRLPSDAAFVLDAFFGSYAVLSIWSLDLGILNGAAYPIAAVAERPTRDRQYRQRPDVYTTQRLLVFSHDSGSESSTMMEDLKKVLSELAVE